MQRTGNCGSPQRVALQGEMVHADLDIAGFLQQAATEFIECALFVTQRQIRLREMTLPGLYPGHMRIAVEGNSIRSQSLYRVYRLRDAAVSLERESIDQVVINRVESDCARGFGNETHLGFGLNPIHRLLHARFEILNSETEAAEAEAIEYVELVFLGHAGIGFD